MSKQQSSVWAVIEHHGPSRSRETLAIFEQKRMARRYVADIEVTARDGYFHTVEEAPLIRGLSDDDFAAGEGLPDDDEIEAIQSFWQNK